MAAPFFRVSDCYSRFKCHRDLCSAALGNEWMDLQLVRLLLPPNPVTLERKQKAFHSMEMKIHPETGTAVILTTQRKEAFNPEKLPPMVGKRHSTVQEEFPAHYAPTLTLRNQYWIGVLGIGNIQSHKDGFKSNCKALAPFYQAVPLLGEYIFCFNFL